MPLSELWFIWSPQIPSKLDIPYGLLGLWHSFGDWLTSLLWLSSQPSQMQSIKSSSNDGQSTVLPPTVISPAQPDVPEYLLSPEDYNSYLHTSETCSWPSKAFIWLVACDQITQSVLVVNFPFVLCLLTMNTWDKFLGPKPYCFPKVIYFSSNFGHFWGP